MDLHLIPGAVASEAEREAIDRAIGDGAGQRHLLLPALHAAQARAGWISEGALNHICTRLSVPPAEAYGVASFYAMFALKPRPARVIHVCDDIACRTRGAEELCRQLTQQIGVPGTPAANGAATWLRSPCLGLCEQAPAALVQAAGDAPADYELPSTSLDQVVKAVNQRPEPAPGTKHQAPSTTRSLSHVPQTLSPRDASLRLLRRVGVADPGSLDDYRAHGGYTALRRALEIGPERVLREVLDAKLVGRGGAAFPTGRKWEAVTRSPVRPHYLVCNADESEPGTFKTRSPSSNR
jgi:NADH-quinone oxidoreductase subunit F